MSKMITLDDSCITPQAISLLKAYDIPFEHFIDALLASNDSLLGGRQERIPVLENILALHVPQGSDYYALSDDANLLDRALTPWRSMIERVRLDQGFQPYQDVKLDVIRHVPDGVVLRISTLPEDA